MSRDFASFMASLSEDSAEQKIQELMEILDKVMQIIINTSDSLYAQLGQIETEIHQLLTRIVNLESRPVAAAPGAAPGAPASTTTAATAPPPPKPEPKPLSPMSARAALQSELKALFARRKK
ncbi:MAG: hypothetical protein ACTSRS_21230 [Candidatus Helarchaeota archaeon]